ncbi:MAG: diacylglycerol kinase family lipid kinase [bacterium]|nr:diacylglycerol kinase family lipid kinase [bacterium]
MNKIHVIVNPYSARGKTGDRWSDIKETIGHYFDEFKFVFTEKPKQATEIARELLQDGFDLIIGVGGDGTLNEITNGFFNHNSRQVINEEAALGIIPSGTGSDFIRYLKIPGDFRKSVALIKNSPIRKIDVGKLTFGGPGRESHGRYFVNVADFGLGAEVIRNLSSVPSGKRGAFSYYKGLLSTIKTYRSSPVRIVLDGKEEISGKYLIGAVANGPVFGGGMKIAPGALPDDGYFDLVLIDDMTRIETIINSRHLYTGKLDKHPKVTIKRAKKITVTSDEPVHIEYDGEMGEALPAEFEVLEKSLNFRV